MIFVTTGTQGPFPRLEEMMRKLTPQLHEEVVVQGEQLLSEEEYAVLFKKARIVVAHAGVGTLLTALRYNKPLIVVPRRVEYGEHRDNHQLDTVGLIRERNLCYVAETQEEILFLLLQQDLSPLAHIDATLTTPNQLQQRISELTSEHKILAVASFGGHMLELRHILRYHQGEKIMVSSGGQCDYQIVNFSRWSKRKGFSVFCRLFWIIRHEQPDIIITTGAAPGLMAILAGWLLRKQTIWIDSLAARKRLSLSARLAQPFATHIYTQSPDLANKTIQYIGEIL